MSGASCQGLLVILQEAAIDKVLLKHPKELGHFLYHWAFDLCRNVIRKLTPGQSDHYILCLFSIFVPHGIYWRCRELIQNSRYIKDARVNSKTYAWANVGVSGQRLLERVCKEASVSADSCVDIQGPFVKWKVKMTAAGEQFRANALTGTAIKQIKIDIPALKT